MRKIVAFFLLLCAVGLAVVAGGLVLHFRDVPLPALLADFSLSRAEGALVRTILPGFMGSFEANCRDSARSALTQQGRTIPPDLDERIAALCSCSGRYVTSAISSDDIQQMAGEVLRGEKPQPTPHLQEAMGEAVHQCLTAR